MPRNRSRIRRDQRRREARIREVQQRGRTKRWKQAESGVSPYLVDAPAYTVAIPVVAPTHQPYPEDMHKHHFPTHTEPCPMRPEVCYVASGISAAK